MTDHDQHEDSLVETIEARLENYGYNCINTESGYHESPDEGPIAREIIALVREAMLSDKAKNASAHEMQELSAQGVISNHTLAFYGMKAALDAAGITGAGQEGGGDE